MLRQIVRLTESMFIDDTEQVYEQTISLVRQALARNRIQLPQLIIKHFQYEKEKFTQGQLSELFEGIKLKLEPHQLDSIMKNLDPDGNSYVFLGELKRAVGQSMTQSRLSIHSGRGEVTAWMEHLVRILKENGPYQTLQLFDDDSDGNIIPQELMLYLESVELEVDRKVVIDTFFGDHKQYSSISDILRILGIQPEQQFIEHNSNSMRCSLIEMSKSTISKHHSIGKSKIVKVTKNMAVIEQYVNLYTQIEEPLLSMAINEISLGRKFFDADNPKPKNGLTYKHIQDILGPTYFLFEIQKSIIRMGIGTILDSRNIIQGKGKDCYFLSAAAGIVQHYPEFIYKLFVLDQNPADIYGLRLFIDGEWQTVVVDAQIPVDDKGIIFYAKPYRSQIWVLLLEKAWAKVYGSYENIEGGNPQEGLTSLTGAPCIKLNGEDPMIVEKLRHYLQQNYIVTANTSEVVSAMGKADQKLKGIYENHAYTVIGLFENLPWNKPGSKLEYITLVKVRNPWGRGIWKGDWSFDCPLWTPQLRKLLGYLKDPKNGSFYMSIKHFLLMFGTMKVCLLTPVNVNSSLKLTSKKKEFAFAKIRVYEQGMYFLSIYQQSTRRYKQQPTSAKHATISHIFVGSITVNNKFIPTASKTHNREKTHLEVWLAVGEHIVFCRLKWSHTNQGKFILGCYGPSPVDMTRIEPIPRYPYDYVYTKSMEQRGEKVTYAGQGHPESYRTIFLSMEEGYGYVIILNNSYQHMKVELWFSESRGIKPIAPGTLPLTVTILPKNKYVLCLLVEPKAKYILQETSHFV